MARRGTTTGRPHDHLLAAAAVHSRIVNGEPHPSELEDGQADEQEPTRAQRRARSQRRNEEGKFA